MYRGFYIMHLHQHKQKEKPILNCYRVYHWSDQDLPKYATEKSACFDIHADFSHTYNFGRDIQSYYEGEEQKREAGDAYILRPQERALIPTGFVFKLPEGYSLRLHPRSGLAWKYGVTLLNGEGVIDEDYYNETFALMYNAGNSDFIINHNDRICQGEIVKTHRTIIGLVSEEPKQTTDRAGGFGSTGVKE